MERTLDLTTILQQEVLWYHQATSQNGQTLYFEDINAGRFIVVFIPDYHAMPPQKPGVIVSAKRINDIIVIDADTTDHPLHEALMQAGIPREKIILAYSGEKLPTPQGE